MKRILLWASGIIALLIVVIALAFWLSPWPSAFLISRMFAGADVASEAALAKHVPPGIRERRNLAYGPEPEDRFDIFYPAGASKPRSTIVWVHGGAWIAGTKEGVSNYLKTLAGEGYTTIAVEYSTGFGSRYPRPVVQVNEALGYLVKNAAELEIDPERLVLAGDSAGAQIAAQVANIITDPGYARRIGIAPTLPPDGLKGMMLLSGAYDFASIRPDSDNAWFVNTVLWAYSGVKDFANDPQFKLASVTRFVTPAFPPTFISSGNADPLAPQAVALARKLEGFGVPVDSLFFAADRKPKLQHEYQFNLDSKDGQLARVRMLQFLGTVTSNGRMRSPAVTAGPTRSANLPRRR